MEQLNLFDVPTTTVTATPRIIPTQDSIQEEPIFELSANVERIKATKEVVEKSVVESIEVDRSLAPTWEVNFYDKDKRERLEWYRCEDEEEAREATKKAYPNLTFIRSVSESKYTLEQIQAMD